MNTLRSEENSDPQVRADRIMQTVEREGRRLPVSEYITMLEEVIRQCRDCVAAAREDQRRG